MSDYLLEFQDIYYRYPLAETNAIDSLSFRLPRGKNTALIGQNGCGKSTLFLLADGLYQPDRGQIQLDGTSLTFDRAALNRWRQRVGLVFQDPEQQLVAPTVAADISYGLCNQGLSDAAVAQKVSRTLADFDLEHLALWPLHHLSLGQKKRVSIAGVMALQPDLLLLDEPTAYLDPIQTRNLLLELEKIAQLGTTLLVATHDLDFVYQWADWVLVMQSGRLLLEGETLAVFELLATMPEFELGMPLLWQMWQTLPPAIRSQHKAPRSIGEMQSIMKSGWPDSN